VAAVLLGLAAALAAPAVQELPPQEPIGSFDERVSVSWALVPVLVQSADGYVDDLTRDDFRLWVDDAEVPIADFESGATAPVSLVFLQDLSGSMANGGKLVESRRALAYLLSQARPEDEFALASFAGGLLQVEVPFTHDEQVLAEAMDLWEGYGTTALHDAVSWIPRISAEGRHPKRAVVVVSDGVDNASLVSPEAARQVVRDAQLPVYVLGLGRHEAAAQNGDSTYARLLTELAAATGGHYFPVEPGDEVYRAAANLLEQLRRQYVLAFPTRAGEAGYRRIRVEVTADDRFTVYHRKGYRGGPPAVGNS
jgi:Ca-activated chloride channel family protein